MEKTLLTKEQQIILKEISGNEFLAGNFYFTGGTVLAEYYLHHRLSDDLDFFSQNKFDSQTLFTFLTSLSKKHNFTYQTQFVDPTYICILNFPENLTLKLDFAYYPYPRLEEGSAYGNLQVDSLTDIAVNKLLSILQRTEVKDYVDLYFLLKKFTVWDLITGVKAKFNQEVEPLILASHFVLAENFTYLPRMVIPVELSEVRDFFLKEAEKMGGKVTQ